MLLNRFMESLRTIHCCAINRHVIFIAYMICNQRGSVISAYLLIIEASKINTYIKEVNGTRL